MNCTNPEPDALAAEGSASPDGVSVASRVPADVLISCLIVEALALLSGLLPSCYGFSSLTHVLACSCAQGLGAGLKAACRRPNPFVLIGPS